MSYVCVSVLLSPVSRRLLELDSSLACWHVGGARFLIWFTPIPFPFKKMKDYSFFCLFFWTSFTEHVFMKNVKSFSTHVWQRLVFYWKKIHRHFNSIEFSFAMRIFASDPPPWSGGIYWAMENRADGGSCQCAIISKKFLFFENFDLEQNIIVKMDQMSLSLKWIKCRFFSLLKICARGFRVICILSKVIFHFILS